MMRLETSLLTLTTLSQPHDTMTGFRTLGLNLTQDTLQKADINTLAMHRTDPITTNHSVCPSSFMSNLHSPKVFHSLIVLSREPETICRLSALKLTERTSEVWPTKRRVVNPVLRSHRRRVWSQEEERANWPSDEITTSDTKWLWPCRILLG